MPNNSGVRNWRRGRTFFIKLIIAGCGIVVVGGFFQKCKKGKYLLDVQNMFENARFLKNIFEKYIFFKIKWPPYEIVNSRRVPNKIVVGGFFWENK